MEKMAILGQSTDRVLEGSGSRRRAAELTTDLNYTIFIRDGPKKNDRTIGGLV